jgi:hypothetical protein
MFLKGLLEGRWAAFAHLQGNISPWLLVDFVRRCAVCPFFPGGARNYEVFGEHQKCAENPAFSGVESPQL